MPGGAGREDYSAMPVGGSGANYSSKNGNKSTKTHTGNGVQKVSTAVSTAKFLKSGNPVSLAYQFGYNLLKAPFKKKTSQQKVELNIKKGLDPSNPAEMHGYETRKKTYDWGPQGNGGDGNVTTITQSLVTAPTADKAAGFGHQWNFQAYGNNTQTAANPYDYTKSPYAKKGKLVRKYATGQEIKNFSKGKRFGPPPLKGPDPQGLQVILENSDYFKKLIG